MNTSFIRAGIAAAAVWGVSAGIARAGETAPKNADMVPLKLDLPRPMFVGTPVPMKLKNIEPARKGARPDMMVPKGTVNLSKDRPVKASDMEPLLGEIKMVTDGEKSAEEGCCIEMGPGRQWVQIDLGAPSVLRAIVLWHFHVQPRAYHDVVVQVSDDPEFAKDVKTIFNNDDDNSSGLGAGTDLAYVETAEGKLIDAKGVTGRYVRLYSKGNTSNELNHYIEVEVWGEKAATPASK